MGKLLLISDLETNHLSSVERALQKVESTIEQIILHYAYQIPANVNNVIAIHDEIKHNANQKLSNQAKLIQKQTGIYTSINLSLGGEVNTIKRLLYNSKFDVVISNDSSLEIKFKKEFPNVQFLKD